MYIQFHEWTTSFLPELILTSVWAPLIVGALTFSPYILVFICELKNGAPRLLTCIAYLGLALFLAYLFTPNFNKLSRFADSYPLHEDAYRFENALKNRNYRELAELNTRWSKRFEGAEILDLWKLINLLPKNHFLRSEFQYAAQMGVISNQDYEEIVSKLLLIDIDICADFIIAQQHQNCSMM